MKSQANRRYILSDERLEQLMALRPDGDKHGGYVIMPDGKVAAVADCGHFRVLSKHYDGSYHNAYRAGAIRISFCGRHDEFWIELGGDNTTLAALQALRRIARRYEAIRPYFEMDDIDANTRKVIERREENSIKKLMPVITRLIARRMKEAADAKRELVPALLP